MADLCCSSHCHPPGRHEASCTAEDCRGCAPAPSAPGFRLCWHCIDKLGSDVMRVPQRFADLELVLIASGGAGERTSGSRIPGLSLNEAAAYHRSVIRHVLVAITRHVVESRGLQFPADTVLAMAEFIASTRNRQWLAADEGAAEHADELHDLAHGDSYRIAYPSGTRVVEVAPCVELVDGQRCPGVAKAIMRPADSLFPPEIACDHNPEHRWPASQWRRVFGGKAA